MIIHQVYIFLLTGVFAVLELFLRNFGLFFPFCSIFIFYIAVTFGSGWGFGQSARRLFPVEHRSWRSKASTWIRSANMP